MSKKPANFIVRGASDPSPLGRTVFCGLRALDPMLQRSILLAAPLSTIFPKLGLSAPSPAPNVLGARLITTLGLDLTPAQALIFAFSVGSAAKQILWVTTSNEPVSVPFAIGISLFNTVNNSLNSLIFTAAASNPAYLPPYSLYLGAALYAVGILVEPAAEMQRKRFKDDPANKGKCYSGGLFSLARHINYGGYTLWRTGFALAAGGPIWGGLVATFFATDFATRAIPALDEYCGGKYGEQWEQFKRDVPWKLLPGIY